MFKQLLPLIGKATVLLVVSPLTGDRLRVTVTPKSSDENKPSFPSLSVEGTADELDTGLPDALATYTLKALSLSESLAVADAEGAALIETRKKELEAQRKTTQKTGTKADAKPAAPAAPVPLKAPKDQTLELGLVESPVSEESAPPAAE